jgi:hypothetical protein
MNLDLVGLLSIYLHAFELLCCTNIEKNMCVVPYFRASEISMCPILGHLKHMPKKMVSNRVQNGAKTQTVMPIFEHPWELL